MKRKLKRTIAALSAIAMLGTTATVLPEGMSFDFGTGITASAAGTEQQSKDEASVTINGTTLYYATLEEAFSAANGKTATITMLKDAECINYAGVPFCVDSGESDITLKMNGKTLSGLGKEGCGAITVKAGSLAIQGPGNILSIHKGLSCEFNAGNIAVENVTFYLNSCDYGIWVDSSNPVILDNVQVYERAYKGAVYISNSGANVIINNMSAPEYGRCDVVYRGGCGLIINGGTFDKISDERGKTSVSNVLGKGCIYRNKEDKTWVTSDLSNTYEISNVTVEKIPLTINPAAEITSWYYNSAEHSLQMNAQPTTTGNEITYEWYDGDKKLECTSDTYTVPKTTPIGSYTCTCKATCDGYTLSHDFTFTVEECKHEGIEITFNSNGFGNCPKCNATVTVYQPAVETIDKYDIDDDGTKDTVYEISNAGQLYWFAGLVNGTLDGVKQNPSANAILAANITANENLLDSLQYDAEGNVSNGSDFISWTPIADCTEDHITQYSGTFDGNNKTVSGLYLNGNSARIGLFGSSEANCNIKNVGVVDSYFKGNDFVGGVCGRNDGTITNCYNAGNLTAIDPTAAIGGICGYNGNGGTIANCYNTGTVTATGSVASVGGVCGCSLAAISNCYNTGTVTATSSGADISGICGYYFGPVTNCYYLADTEDENGGKTAAQFASGEIAYLLSQGCTVGGGEGENAVTYSGSVWGQNLATENYPVLNGETVYQVDSYEGCIGNPGNSTKVYSNTNAPIYVEHNYSSKGACTICGAFKNGIGEHLDGYSLSLDGNIGVNFFMELDKSVIADENAYMKFRLPNGKTSVVLVGDAKQQTVGGTTYYVFSCEVAAKEMNETITAQIITSDKKGEVYEYSVADYIQYIRDNPTEFDEKTLSLVNAMAGYGDYAKAYFNNENLDANTEMDAVTADTLASFDKQISGDLPEGITYYGSSLLLESNTTVRHYFKVAEGTDASTLNFSGSKSGYYYIDIPNISAEKLGTIQNVTIGNCTISYSPMSYAYAVLSSKNTSESLKNLVKSLYLYEQAAEAYKN